MFSSICLDNSSYNKVVKHLMYFVCLIIFCAENASALWSSSGKRRRLGVPFIWRKGTFQILCTGRQWNTRVLIFSDFCYVLVCFTFAATRKTHLPCVCPIVYYCPQNLYDSSQKWLIFSWFRVVLPRTG